jgi:hypothetical protein
MIVRIIESEILVSIHFTGGWIGGALNGSCFPRAGASPLPIADCGFPIANWFLARKSIGIWQLAIGTVLRHVTFNQRLRRIQRRDN